MQRMQIVIDMPEYITEVKAIIEQENEDEEE